MHTRPFVTIGPVIYFQPMMALCTGHITLGCCVDSEDTLSKSEMNHITVLYGKKCPIIKYIRCAQLLSPSTE